MHPGDGELHRTALNRLAPGYPAVHLRVSHRRGQGERARDGDADTAERGVSDRPGREQRGEDHGRSEPSAGVRHRARL